MYRSVVSICTAQWSVYVPHSSQYMTRPVVTIYSASLRVNNSTFCPHSCIFVFCVVSICTAQWSLYLPHSGHYMYCTVVSICTAQWPVNVPLSGRYMYRTVVSICTTQWSLYVPPSGYYIYRQFNSQQFCVLPTQLYLCFLWSVYVPH